MTYSIEKERKWLIKREKQRLIKRYLKLLGVDRIEESEMKKIMSLFEFMLCKHLNR